MATRLSTPAPVRTTAIARRRHADEDGRRAPARSHRDAGHRVSSVIAPARGKGPRRRGLARAAPFAPERVGVRRLFLRLHRGRRIPCRGPQPLPGWLRPAPRSSGDRRLVGAAARRSPFVGARRPPPPLVRRGPRARAPRPRDPLAPPGLPPAPAGRPRCLEQQRGPRGPRCGVTLSRCGARVSSGATACSSPR